MDYFPAKVLLATDGSEDAVLASRAAIDLTNKTGSELHLVYAWQFPSMAYSSISPEASTDVYERLAEELLAEQVRLVGEAGGTIAGAHLRMGSTAEEIIGLTEDLGAGLIVVGSRGLGPVRRLVIGSVSEGIVHTAHCPVLVLRGGSETWPPERVIMGDDDSEEAKNAGELAARIGKLFNAKGHLVRVYPQPPEVNAQGREFNARTVEDELHREERALEDRAAQIQGALGVRPRIRIAVGDPAALLLRTAEEGVAEKTLLAVGSRGLGAVRRVRLGSVSTKVLHAARGPVLVYPRSSS